MSSSTRAPARAREHRLPARGSRLPGSSSRAREPARLELKHAGPGTRSRASARARGSRLPAGTRSRASAPGRHALAAPGPARARGSRHALASSRAPLCSGTHGRRAGPNRLEQSGSPDPSSRWNMIWLPCPNPGCPTVRRAHRTHAALQRCVVEHPVAHRPPAAAGGPIERGAEPAARTMVRSTMCAPA